MNFNGPIEVGQMAGTTREANQAAPASLKRGRRGRLMLLGTAVVLAGAFTSGAWNHLTQYRLTAAAAEQERDFVPSVRVAAVAPSDVVVVIKLPAT
jgi:hypothetical protein